jgi:hypothetical protein
MGGNYLVSRGTTIFPAQSGQPEESTDDVGYFAYDRDRRKYVAYFYFSTGIIGIFDVDFPQDGTVRLVSSSLLNYEAGARMRLTFTRKSDAETGYQIDIAPSGKDFVPFLSSKLGKK